MRKLLSNAVVVTDKFHVLQYAGATLDELHRIEYSKQKDKTDFDLKKCRFLILKANSRLAGNGKSRIDQLKESTSTQAISSRSRCSPSMDTRRCRCRIPPLRMGNFMRQIGPEAIRGPRQETAEKQGFLPCILRPQNIKRLHRRHKHKKVKVISGRPSASMTSPTSDSRCSRLSANSRLSLGDSLLRPHDHLTHTNRTRTGNVEYSSGVVGTVVFVFLDKFHGFGKIYL